MLTVPDKSFATVGGFIKTCSDIESIELADKCDDRKAKAQKPHDLTLKAYYSQLLQREGPLDTLRYT